jgi:integral membrane protein (TIGR00529 family)
VDLLTLRLALSIVLILILGELLRETAGLSGMVEALQVLVPNSRVVMAGLPALVGLLPMVGGAMFSAPMVDEVGDRIGADQERKMFVNYWFRHIWEYAFPLYPAVMLGAALLNLETFQLAEMTWPLSAAALLGGSVFGLLGIPGKPDDDSSASGRRESVRTLVSSVWPVALVIILSLTLPIDDGIALILSLVVTMALMMVAKGVSLRALGRILYRHIPWATVVVLFGALVFRRVLDGSGAVDAVSQALTASHVPLAMVAFSIPFIAGLLTGLAIGAVSIGFPVVLPLVAPSGVIAPGWAAWLMAGGFLGVMCSPLHLCLSLTRAYFKADWGPVYRRIVPSALVVTVTAALLLLS